jgi:beta-galactosidase
MNKLFFGIVMLISFQTIAQKGEKFFPSKELTTVGVYYYPEHWDSTQWERDFKNMAGMGFEFTHFAEFAWAQLEPEEGKYDFGWLDRAVGLAGKYNLKVVMCTSTATPPVWLVRKYPEVLVKNENGTVNDHGSRQNASFSSTFFRQYSLKMVAELAKRYGKNKQVTGWQLDNEPRKFYDYNNDAQLRFRGWLEQKYKNIGVLNKAWGTNFWSGTYSDFQQINIPKISQWGMNLHQRLDHSRFADQETASFLDDQAKVIRKYSAESQWITSNYIPMYDVGYVGMSRGLDFVSYTRYMVYGADRGIGRNGYRLGEYSKIAMANDFFRPMAGYYGVMELQPGQVNWGTINAQPLPGAVRLWLWHVLAGGSRFTCTYRYRAPLYGFEQYHYGIVGTDGVTPTPGGKEFSRFIQEIKVLREKYNPNNRIPKEVTNRKTGVLFNPDNVMAINQNKQTTEWDTEGHFLKYYKALKSFGAPVDFVRDTTNFSDYPFMIVPAYQQIDKLLINKLTSYAENGGHLVMTCRTGHQDRDGHLWEAPFARPIYDLIGAGIDSYDLLMPHSPDSVRFEGKPYAWTSWGEILNPRAGTDSWATYKGDFYAGRPAVISRKLGKGSVTYVGVDSKSGEFERKILSRVFNENGVKIENYPAGIIVEYRDGFGIAMNYSDKNYEMKLPESAGIIFGDKSIPQGGVLVWNY